MNIAILGATDEPTWLEDIQTKLMATTTTTTTVAP